MQWPDPYEFSTESGYCKSGSEYKTGNFLYCKFDIEELSEMVYSYSGYWKLFPAKRENLNENFIYGIAEYFRLLLLFYRIFNIYNRKILCIVKK